MSEKSGLIKNPLTVISGFAAIAEVSGTIVLPLISPENQFYFMCFLMGFPTLLVSLFFWTLNKNHHVLYAPSDFKNEDNYFKRFERTSEIDKAIKLREEAKEIQSNITDTSQQNHRQIGQPRNLSYTEINETFKNIEKLVLRKISMDEDSVVVPNVTLRLDDGRKLSFDAVSMGSQSDTLIEVKYFPDESKLNHNVKMSLLKLRAYMKDIPIHVGKDLSVNLMIVTDNKISGDIIENIAAETQNKMFDIGYPLSIKYMSLADLKKEFQDSDVASENAN